MKKLALLLFSTLVLLDGAAFAKDFKIDTPAEAIFAYFPSPATLRCLNHSDLIKKNRKAEISRKAKIDGVDVEETIFIHSSANKVKGTGSLTSKDLIVPLKINTGIFNGSRKSKKASFSFDDLNPINALQELVGIQKRITIKDKIGNQDLNYTTYLKKTKGKVGKDDYNIEITGQDIGRNGQLMYLISGTGNIGIDTITISGKEIEKDNYVLNEKYGNLKVFTKVTVFN
jgi:hypothetical protein